MTKELTTIDKAKQLIMKNEIAFKAVLPDNFPVDKFIATFCLEVQKNPKLANCDNLIEVARDVASFGLVIGGLAQQSHLIPFDKKVKIGNEWTTQTKAQLIIGYRGYITKLEEAGYSVEVEIVTNNEVDTGCFQEVRGSETKIVHRPIRKGIRDRESIALAYCIIKGKDSPPVIAVLSKEEIEEMAKTEKWVDGDNGKKTKERALGNVWMQDQRETDFGQMCIKTVIRNCVKKVNLRIANEMSSYEGQRDSEIMRDITPDKKRGFNVSDLKDLKNSRIIKEEEIDQDEVVEIVTNNNEVIEQAFKRVADGIKAMANPKAVNIFFDKSSAEDLNYLKENKPAYHAELLFLKDKRLEELSK